MQKAFGPLLRIGIESFGLFVFPLSGLAPFRNHHHGGIDVEEIPVQNTFILFIFLKNHHNHYCYFFV